jgi:phosphatidylglycerophosphate synthase
MSRTRTAMAAVAAQVAILGVLAATVGLSGVGVAVGLLTSVATNFALARALRAAGAGSPGPANLVTLTRATLVAAVAALVSDGTRNLTLTLTLTAMALALDAVDGQVARRTGSTSPVGARFDGEVDAFLILVLSIAVARTTGSWVLAIGAWRYVFAVAGWMLPWLRQPLPHSMWGKTVAAIQGVVLLVALSGVLPHVVTVVLLAVALAVLSESFWDNIRWLWKKRSPVRAEVSRPRRVLGGVLTGVALAVVWVAFVAPDRPYDLALTAFVRIPADGLIVVVVALVLRDRARRFFAFMVGFALAGLTLIRMLDIGFFSVLDRPFSPLSDWASIQPGIKVLMDSIGRNRALLAVAVAIAVAALLLTTIVLAVARVMNAAGRHRRVSARAVVALGAAWLLSVSMGLTTGGGLPAASDNAAQTLSEEVHLVRAELRSDRVFNTQLAAADRFALTPPAKLLNGLRGKDVLLVFIESYGRVAVDGSSFSPPIDALLKRGTARLTAAGYSTRSAFLTSPTFGSRSWFAHSTLQSGLWIDNPSRYSRLTATKRFTLSQAFGRAGWRTVFDLPATTVWWPEGQRFYHFDTMYDAKDVGYRGPPFSFAKVPDQFTLQALNQRELDRTSRPPLFAEVVLDSSHAPWTPLPRMVPWRDLGNGKVFAPMTRHAMSPATVWASAKNARAAYATSIRYTLRALVSFLQRSQDKNLVVIALGDHQPATLITGYNATHEVPVTIFARDRRVIRRIASWGWQDGLLPNAQAPVWRMDSFRDRFLTAYGPSISPAVEARGSPPLPR